ncbi:RNA polymerase sigma-70 factor [Parapedobacter sp. SGR-10]|uniref:RNA polymerase sigma factor n=1 Tax=Parapedobacter sp. SGR-10 TaxID=2710879 RepID=UPI0013D33B3A|nr:RNA polymerase sigma-70 factor [Parapedobacter sp. SGR-10]NGF56375.1 RNA polymerase sigma-70 factor [Parapedobacter sp. SGR-10]
MSKSTLHNERALLLRIVEGDEEAFCAVFDHYSKFVYSFGYKLVRSSEVAEEVVQDIFMKVWEGKEKLLDIDNFGAYLNVLVRNHSLNLLRQLAKKQTVDVHTVSDLPVQDYSTEHTIEYRDTLMILEEVLAALPDHQREIYRLCHLEGLRYEEAAAKMGISPNTVHYHMKSALKTIREYLIKRGGAYQALLFFFFNFY